MRRGAAVLAVLLLAACGGGGDSSSDDTTTTTVDRTAAKADLTGRLLTPADLAPSDPLDKKWLVGDVAEGVDIQLPSCVVEEIDPKAIAGAEAKLVLDSPLHLPSLEEGIDTYAKGGAETAFAAAEQRLDGCTPEFVYQGTPSAGHIERLPLTLPGTESAAWRTTVTIAEAPVAITSIHVRQGDVELSLVHVDIGTPDVAVLEGYAAKAVAKLR